MSGVARLTDEDIKAMSDEELVAYLKRVNEWIREATAVMEASFDRWLASRRSA